jgi:hypothetical protein
MMIIITGTATVTIQVAIIMPLAVMIITGIITGTGSDSDEY